MFYAKAIEPTNSRRVEASVHKPKEDIHTHAHKHTHNICNFKLLNCWLVYILKSNTRFAYFVVCTNRFAKARNNKLPVPWLLLLLLFHMDCSTHTHTQHEFAHTPNMFVSIRNIVLHEHHEIMNEKTEVSAVFEFNASKWINSCIFP